MRHNVTRGHRSSLQFASIGIILSLLLVMSVWVEPAGAQPVPDVPAAMLGVSAQADCTDPANPVVAENCQPGSTEWVVDNHIGDIEGFAYPPSINRGERVDFYVNTTAAQFTIDIYRSGYYGGTGGRLIDSLSDVPGTDQPDCHEDLYGTGLTSCGNWSISAGIDTGADWVSGIYVAKLTRPDTGGESYMLFTLRDDERDAPILYQQSLFTYHAYNNHGGKSVYDFNSGYCETDTDNPRSAKVSLMRPYSPSIVAMEEHNSYFRAEYPMVRWLEQQGYDLSYSTNLDTHRSGLPGADNELLDHDVFLSVGHDEYWTQQIDDAISQARDAGVHLGVFSANTSYWRVRLEDDPWTGEPDSVIVTYKSTEAGPPDPSGHPTGTFRDPEGVDDPENSLVGIMYIGDNDQFYFPMRVSAEYSGDRIYRHTDLQALPDGTYVEIGDQIFGWEWDAVVDNGHTPDNLDILAETPVYGFLIRDAGDSANGTSGAAVAHTSRYVAPSGAIVFAAGTIQWSWGLGARGTDVIPPDPYIQQITYNVLADMGVQPASPADGLVLDGEDGVVTSPDHPVVAAATVQAPVISGISVDTSASLLRRGRVATIAWETDRPTQAQLWLNRAPMHAGEIRGYFADLSASRSVALAALWPGSTYYYRILVIDAQGVVTLTDQMRFETPANPMVAIGSPILDTVRDGRCWAQGHPTAAAGLGVGLAAVVVLGGVGAVSWWRRRKKRGQRTM